MTSMEVITRTLSTVMTLYLNLNPGCLCFCGTNADSSMKVAELFATLEKLLKGDNRNKVTGLNSRIFITI